MKRIAGDGVTLTVLDRVRAHRSSFSTGAVAAFAGDGSHARREYPMRRSGDQVSAAWRYERVEGASHRMVLDAPERINAPLVDFVA